MSKKNNCHKFINKNSDILVITVQCLYTKPIHDNNCIINDNLSLSPYCMERQTHIYGYDFLLLRDPYTIYYITCNT